MKQCSECHSTHIVKAGRHRTRKGLWQMWKCQRCGKSFVGGRIG